MSESFHRYGVEGEDLRHSMHGKKLADLNEDSEELTIDRFIPTGANFSLDDSFSRLAIDKSGSSRGLVRRRTGSNHSLLERSASYMNALSPQNEDPPFRASHAGILSVGSDIFIGNGSPQSSPLCVLRKSTGGGRVQAPALTPIGTPKLGPIGTPPPGGRKILEKGGGGGRYLSSCSLTKPSNNDPGMLGKSASFTSLASLERQKRTTASPLCTEFESPILAPKSVPPRPRSPEISSDHSVESHHRAEQQQHRGEDPPQQFYQAGMVYPPSLELPTPQPYAPAPVPAPFTIPAAGFTPPPLGATPFPHGMFSLMPMQHPGGFIQPPMMAMPGNGGQMFMVPQQLMLPNGQPMMHPVMLPNGQVGMIPVMAPGTAPMPAFPVPLVPPPGTGMAPVPCAHPLAPAPAPAPHGAGASGSGAETPAAPKFPPPHQDIGGFDARERMTSYSSVASFDDNNYAHQFNPFMGGGMMMHAPSFDRADTAESVASSLAYSTLTPLQTPNPAFGFPSHPGGGGSSLETPPLARGRRPLLPPHPAAPGLGPGPGPGPGGEAAWLFGPPGYPLPPGQPHNPQAAPANPTPPAAAATAATAAGRGFPPGSASGELAGGALEGGDAPGEAANPEDLRGQVLRLARDQVGCRLLQRVLEEGRPPVVRAVFQEALGALGPMMTDPFGNYLFQKLMERAAPDQRLLGVAAVCAAPPPSPPPPSPPREGDGGGGGGAGGGGPGAGWSALAGAARNLHGTRSAQRLVELVAGSKGSAREVALVAGALRPHVVPLALDPNGNHVLQKVLQHFPVRDHLFVAEALLEACAEVAVAKHGCCVLQRCLDATDRPHRRALINAVTSLALPLVQDRYGNYVVQYVLDNCEGPSGGGSKGRNPGHGRPPASAAAAAAAAPHTKAGGGGGPPASAAGAGAGAGAGPGGAAAAAALREVCEALRGHLVPLATQKFSSNVVERCLEKAPKDLQEAFIDELCQNDATAMLLQDQFGNYVIQRALSVAGPEQGLRLVSAIRPHLHKLRASSSGRRVATKILKRFPDADLGDGLLLLLLTRGGGSPGAASRAGGASSTTTIHDFRARSGLPCPPAEGSENRSSSSGRVSPSLAIPSSQLAPEQEAVGAENTSGVGSSAVKKGEKIPPVAGTRLVESAVEVLPTS